MFCLHDASTHLKSARTSTRHASTEPPHNDVVSAMGEEWRKHHAEHGKLPEIEDFAKVVARNLDEMDEELFNDRSKQMRLA